MINIPEARRLLTSEEISNYVSGKFFRCIQPFLSWMKKGETFWFEYHPSTDTYEIRSDSAVGREIKMEIYQLLTCFVPIECETNIYFAIKYFHWLGELEIHHNDIDEIVNWYEESGILNY